jgi:hypothetical protein
MAIQQPATAKGQNAFSASAFLHTLQFVNHNESIGGGREEDTKLTQNTVAYLQPFWIACFVLRLMYFNLKNA